MSGRQRGSSGIVSGGALEQELAGDLDVAERAGVWDEALAAVVLGGECVDEMHHVGTLLLVLRELGGELVDQLIHVVQVLGLGAHEQDRLGSRARVSGSGLAVGGCV